MNPSKSSVDDAQLAQLLEAMLEGARRGDAPDLSEVCRRRPDLAGELRGLWATAMLAEDLAGRGETKPPDEAAAIGGGGETKPPPRRLGDFEILEELGRGGMGVVYKARQTRLDRVVALKMILRGECATRRDLERFRREAESAAKIEHPNIVPIYETGEIDGQPYFSMKYIEGTTLARKLADGPLPPREAATILLAVCRAMAEAHRQGVLHRDLKPANILIDLEGRPHVTDFGLAKRTQQLGSFTESGLMVGTPSYMAPEQAVRGRGDVGVATDVYSLGAILYQTLAGRPPFQAATPLDTVMMLLEHEPAPPRMFHRKADPDLEAIALKCLQKHPDLRYSSVDRLAEDLERYLANEPLSVHSGGWTRAAARVLRETHHAPLLENWGLLWMWNAVVLLAMCLTTNWRQYEGVTTVPGYFALWSFGLGTWAAIFWRLRRRAGPIQFVERQVAHLWAASVVCAPLLYFLEILMGLPVLTLSPVLALIGGTVFLVKASILTGMFYVQAAALFLTAFLMAVFPKAGLTILGVALWASFFFPGLKYYRQRVRVDAGAVDR